MRRLLWLLAASTAIAIIASLSYPIETVIRLGRQGALMVGFAGGDLRLIWITPERSAVPASTASIDDFARDLLAASVLSTPVFTGGKRLYGGAWMTAHQLVDVHLPTMLVSLVGVLLLHAALRDRQRLRRTLTQIRHPSPACRSLLVRCVNRVVVATCLILALISCIVWIQSFRTPSPIISSPSSVLGRNFVSRFAPVEVLEKRVGPLDVCASASSGTILLSVHRVNSDDTRAFDPTPVFMMFHFDTTVPRGWLLPVRWYANRDGFVVKFSCALAIVVLLIWPIVAFIIGPWRRAARAAGFCEMCGYNLTGLPMPRCPECGRAVTQPSDTGPASVETPQERP